MRASDVNMLGVGDMHSEEPNTACCQHRGVSLAKINTNLMKIEAPEK